MGVVRFNISQNRTNLDAKLLSFSELVDRADLVVDRVAEESLARVVTATPSRYTGDTKKQWVHRILGSMVHLVTNPSKVMHWLDKGTKAHGPKTAKALFIPLNKRAWEAGPRGVMEANAKAVVASGGRRFRSGPRKGKVKKPFMQGEDFVWTKWVKGIKAMHIARAEQERVRSDLEERLADMLRKEFK